MMPWVVLGLMLAIGLLISVIYNAVVYFIDGYVLGGTLWIVVGLLSVGKCGCYTHPDQLVKVIIYVCFLFQSYTCTYGSWFTATS